MTTPKIISEQALSLYDVKKELKSIKKRDENLSVRANRVQEYVDQFSSLSEKDATQLKEKLTALEIPRMKEEYISKIIDIMPVSADDVKIVLSGYGITVKNEHVQKIADTLAEFTKK